MYKEETTMKTVKGIRMENGITQEEMAFLLNLSTKQYRFKEQGKAPWLFREVKFVCDYTKTPIQEVKEVKKW